MNNTDNKNKKPRSFRPRLTLAVFCAVAFSVMELALTPLYIYMYSDITVSVTVLPNLVELVLKLAEIFTFAVCYSLVIYCAVTRGRRHAASLCGIYASATVIRRLASLGISYASYGYVDSSDIFNVSVYIVLELLQITAVTLIALRVGKKYNALRDEELRAARRVGDSSDIRKLKFTRVFSKENPLLVCALASGIILAVINIAMRIFYDISYGAPSGIDEVFIMSAYYLSDILTAVIFYTLSHIILSRIFKRDNDN